MDENKPLIEKVILPSFLYKYAIERGQKTVSEVGFYIIGLVQGKIAYCYDLIEFDPINEDIKIYPYSFQLAKSS